MLLNKIPADLQFMGSRKVSEADWNLDDLMDAIEEPEKGLVPVKVALLHAEVSTSLRPPQLPWYQERDPTHKHPVVIATSLIRPVIATPSHKLMPVTPSKWKIFLMPEKGPSESRLSVDYTCRGRHHTSICSSSVQSRGSSDRHPPQPQPHGTGTSLAPVSRTQTPSTQPSSSVPTHTQSILNPIDPAPLPPASTSLCTNYRLPWQRSAIPPSC